MNLLRGLFLLPFLVSSLGEAGCGSACIDASDCSGSCPICVTGYCVDCGALGDEVSCVNEGTGASTLCAWNGGSCDVFNTPTLSTSTVGFGTKGFTVQNFGKISEANAGAYYSNGRLVISGYYDNGSNADFATIRLFADGTLDTTWGSGGQVITDLNGRDDRAHGVAIDPFGRVVVAGRTQTTASSNAFDFGVVRYTSRGQLDTTFNTTGKVTTDFGSLADFARDVAYDTLNRVVVGGYRDLSGIGQNYAFAVARYDTNGILDTKFASAGRATTDVMASQHDTAVAVLTRTDNKTLLIGRTKSGSAMDFAVARYGTNGILDSTFGSVGTIVIDVSTREDLAFTGAWDFNNRLVAAGRSHSGSNYDVSLIRVNSNGSLNTKFASAGKNIKAISTTADDIARGVKVFGSDNILVTGRASNGSNFDLFAMRLLSDGGLDTYYDTDGKYVIDLNGRDDEINSLAYDGAYYFTAIGGSHNGSNLDFAVARISPTSGLAKCGDRNGFLWGSDYAATGALSFDIGSSNATLYDIDFQTDNFIGMLGSYNWRTAIGRISQHGTLDTNFASGVGWTDSMSGWPEEIQRGLKINKQGKITIVGMADRSAVMYRFGTNGVLDSTFSGGGVFVGDGEYLSTILFESNSNKNFAIGTRAQDAIALYRVNSDGSMDTAFASGGSATLLSGLRVGDQMYDLTFASTLAMTACGTHSCGGFLIRTNTNGVLDTCFGSGGVINNTDAQGFFGCQMTPRNRLAVFGQTNNRCAVFRYNSGGILDTKFNTTGVAEIDWASGTDICDGGVMQNGKIMVGGYSDDTYTFRYSRLLSNGSLDGPFHSNPATAADTFAGSAEKMNRVVVSDRDMLFILGEHFASTTHWAIQSIFP